MFQALIVETGCGQKAGRDVPRVRTTPGATGSVGKILSTVGIPSENDGCILAVEQQIPVSI